MERDKQLAIFCKNLRYLRQKHGLSKRNMANILGIGVNTLTSLEQGIASPRLGSSVLYNAGVYFHIRTDDLLHIPLE